MTDFERLTIFLGEENGTEVRIGEMDSFVPSLNRIFVNGSAEPDMQLIALIHEAGHSFQTEHDNRYKKIDPDDNPRARNTFVNLRYENEVNAWDRGENLAIELDLDVNWDLLTTERVEALKTYEKF